MNTLLSSAEGFYTHIKSACETLLNQSKENKQRILERSANIQKLRQDIQEKTQVAPTNIDLATLHQDHEEISSIRTLIRQNDCDSMTHYVSEISKHVSQNKTQDAIQSLEPMLKVASLMKLRLHYIAELQALSQDYANEEKAQRKIQAIATTLELNQNVLDSTVTNTGFKVDKSKTETPALETTISPEILEADFNTKPKAEINIQSKIDDTPVVATPKIDTIAQPTLATYQEIIDTKINIAPPPLPLDNAAIPSLHLHSDTTQRFTYDGFNDTPIFEKDINQSATLEALNKIFDAPKAYQNDTLSVEKKSMLAKTTDKLFDEPQPSKPNRLLSSIDSNHAKNAIDLEELLDEMPELEFEDLEMDLELEKEITPLDELLEKVKKQEHRNFNFGG